MDNASYDVVLLIASDTSSKVSGKESDLARLFGVDEVTVLLWLQKSQAVVVSRGIPRPIATGLKSIALDFGIEAEVRASKNHAFELVPKPTPPSTELWQCPKCGFEKVIKADDIPAQCSNCRVVVAQWLRRQRLAEEKARIVERMKRAHAAEIEKQRNQLGLESENKRKRALENDIANRLGIDTAPELGKFPTNWWAKLRLTSLILLVASSIGLAGYATWELGGRTQNTEVISTKSGKAQTATRILETKQASPEAIYRTERLTNARQILGFNREEATLSGSTQSLSALAQSTNTLNRADPRGSGNSAIRLISQGHAQSTFNDPTYSDTSSDRGAKKQGRTGAESAQEIEAVKIRERALLETHISNSDLEWDKRLNKKAQQLIAETDLFAARRVVNEIIEPQKRLTARIEIFSQIPQLYDDLALRNFKGRVLQDADNISDTRVRATALLDGAKIMKAQGVSPEAKDLEAQVQRLLTETDAPKVKASLYSLMARFEFNRGESETANQYWVKAETFIRRIAEPGERTALVAQLAVDYFDSGQEVLAAEIVSAAEESAYLLEDTKQRDRALIQIALSLSHQEQTARAIELITAVSTRDRRDIGWLRLGRIAADRSQFELALSTYQRISDNLASLNLLQRIAISMMDNEDSSSAINVLEELIRAMTDLPDTDVKVVMTSAVGKLMGRMDKRASANALFSESVNALQNSMAVQRDQTRALVANELARAFRYQEARTVLSGIIDPDQRTKSTDVIKKIAVLDGLYSLNETP